METRVVKEGEKVELLEQYGRKLNLEITGVPVKDEENTNDIVVEIANLPLWIYLEIKSLLRTDCQSNPNALAITKMFLHHPHRL